MTTNNDKPTDGYGLARPGSRLEELMRSRGTYVPQSLLTDFQESLRFICLRGGVPEGDLTPIKVTQSIPSEGFPFTLEVHVHAFNKKTPLPLQSLLPELQEHARGRADIKVVNVDEYIQICGHNFRDMLHLLNDGYIKQHDPEANIDVDGKMSPSWVERSGQGEGQGGGVGGPG